MKGFNLKSGKELTIFPNLTEKFFLVDVFCKYFGENNIKSRFKYTGFFVKSLETDDLFTHF